MRPAGSTFLPDRLRPRLRRHPRRRRLALLAVVPLAMALLPWWRIQAVETVGTEALPAMVQAELDDLVGQSALVLDLAAVRRRVEAWPGIDGVDVHLELPGKLLVVARPVAPCASIRIGDRWHGVSSDGSVAGPLARQLAPTLDGVPLDPQEVRMALAAADRVAAAAGVEVEAVRAVAPEDLELMVRTGDGRRLVVVVGRAASGSESYWSGRVAAGDPPAPWADARSDDRLVIGGVS